jgi:cysteinyl-tRNA synthetase
MQPHLSNPITLFDSYLKTDVQIGNSDQKTINIYSCGPTVYQYQHIGNLRATWLPDTFSRIIKMSGLESKWVLNITDVGHLIGDGDEGKNTGNGEDKLEKSAKLEGKTVKEIVDYYLADFQTQADKLNMRLPERELQPKATDYILEQMLLSLTLIDTGKAYLLPDGIYFDSEANKNLTLPFKLVKGDATFTGRAIENTTKNPADFALWKLVSEDSLQKWRFNEFDETATLMLSIIKIIEDDSFLDLPNRPGCPGWHSECVAMIAKIFTGDFPPTLNEKNAIIDVHFGGEDHIDIHHKNEILQSESLGFHLSKHWVHNKFVLVDGKKMSKSLGNVFLVSGKKEVTEFDSIEEKGYDPLAYRMMMMEHHYTQQLDFTWDKLTQSQTRLHGIRCDLAKIVSFAQSQSVDITNIDPTKITHSLKTLLKPLQTNLNTPLFLEKFQRLIGDILHEIGSKKTIDSRNVMILQYFEKELLELNLFPEIPANIVELAQLRQEAKAEKDYQTSDEMREKIHSEGWQIDDNSWGYSLWKTK